MQNMFTSFLVIYSYVYTFQVIKVGHANQVLPFDDDLHTWKNNSAHAQQSQPYNDILDVSGFLQSLMLLENFLISRWNNELLVLHKHHESNVKFKLEICFKDLFLFIKLFTTASLKWKDEHFLFQ